MVNDMICTLSKDKENLFYKSMRFNEPNNNKSKNKIKGGE